MSFPTNKKMLLAGRKRNPKNGWVIDMNGTMWTLEFVGERNEWAKPLSFLWNIVKSEYKLSKIGKVKTGDVVKMLEGAVDKFPEAPQAKDLKRHLNSYPPDTVISEQLLIEWPI